VSLSIWIGVFELKEAIKNELIQLKKLLSYWLHKQ